MKTKITALFLTAGAIIMFAQTAGAQNAKMWQGASQNIKFSANIGAQSATDRLAALKSQAAKLQELIAKLQEQLGGMTSATSTTPVIDLNCAKTAAETRETAVAAAYSAMSSCVSSSLATRKADLLSAWSLAATNDRHKAINEAWSNFQKTRLGCQKTYKQAIKTAWDNYKNAAKNCKVQNWDAAKEGIDILLEIE